MSVSKEYACTCLAILTLCYKHARAGRYSKVHLGTRWADRRQFAIKVIDKVTHVCLSRSLFHTHTYTHTHKTPPLPLPLTHTHTQAQVTRSKMFKYVLNEKKVLNMLSHPSVLRLEGAHMECV
jgi:hypothetical protein